MRTEAPPDAKPRAPARKVTLTALVGSGDRIALFTLPFVVVGLVLSAAFPSLFDFGEPSAALRWISIAVLIAGVTIWLWSVVLILRKVPRAELITTGPFRLMRHPIYTSVALFVLPWIGVMLGTWLWAVVGVALYVGSRIFAPAEEADLAARFGLRWVAYRSSVLIPWL